MLWPVDGKDGPNLSELPNDAFFVWQKCPCRSGRAAYSATREAATFFGAAVVLQSHRALAPARGSFAAAGALQIFDGGVLYLSNINAALIKGKFSIFSPYSPTTTTTHFPLHWLLHCRSCMWRCGGLSLFDATAASWCTRILWCLHLGR